MELWLQVARRIDWLSEWSGRGASWLALVMILVGAGNAVARYLGRSLGLNLSSNVYLELQWYLFSVLFLLTAAYALKQNAHVRVDVIFSRLPARVRTWIDLLGHLLLLLPFSVFVLVVSWPSVRNSWAILEQSPDPGGLPRYPLKTLILICFLLLVVQGIAQVIKDVSRLRGLLPLVEVPPHGEEPV